MILKITDGEPIRIYTFYNQMSRSVQLQNEYVVRNSKRQNYGGRVFSTNLKFKPILKYIANIFNALFDTSYINLLLEPFRTTVIFIQLCQCETIAKQSVSKCFGRVVFSQPLACEVSWLRDIVHLEETITNCIRTITT